MIVEKQRLAIRELSTPIIELWEGVICLPVVGIMDTARSAEMTNSLLEAIVEKKTRYAIVDITGIEITRDAQVQDARLLQVDAGFAGIAHPGAYAQMFRRLHLEIV